MPFLQFSKSYHSTTGVDYGMSFCENVCLLIIYSIQKIMIITVIIIVDKHT